MTDPSAATRPFTPAVGMVDALDSNGFGPVENELAFIRLYLAPGPLDMAALSKIITPEALAAREQRTAERRARDWPALGQYRDANAALSGQPVEVVFMGDSITEIWGLAQPDLFTDGRINRGISGQTTPQMLLRFMADVVALKPEVLHLLCGVNDIAGNTGPTTPDDFRNNILAMIALAKANDIAVILGTLTPVSPIWRPAVADPAARIVELNGWLRELARTRGLILADYTALLSDSEGHLAEGLHHDGLHPGARGYELMRPVTEDAIRRALASRS